MRKEIYFGLAILTLVVISVFVLMPAPSQMTNGHLGLLMLALIVVAIMLGFPTAFTLMGMGMMFAWFAFHSRNPDLAVQQTLDLMVQRAYSVMSNDVLISIPLFVFMGYLVERANLIEKLFKSLHLAMARIPGSLAVATVVTCAIFATTGIVSAVVMMGLLALPAMPRPFTHPAGGGRNYCRRFSGVLVLMLLIVWRHCRRLGGETIRRRFLPRHHAGDAIYRLHHRGEKLKPIWRRRCPRQTGWYPFQNMPKPFPRLSAAMSCTAWSPA